MNGLVERNGHGTRFVVCILEFEMLLPGYSLTSQEAPRIHTQLEGKMQRFSMMVRSQLLASSICSVQMASSQPHLALLFPLLEH